MKLQLVYSMILYYTLGVKYNNVYTINNVNTMVQSIGLVTVIAVTTSQIQVCTGIYECKVEQTVVYVTLTTWLHFVCN